MRNTAQRGFASASGGMRSRTSSQIWAKGRAAGQLTESTTGKAMSREIADGQQGLSRLSIRAERSLSRLMASRFLPSSCAKGSAFQRKPCAQGPRDAVTITFSRSDRLELRSQAPSNAFCAERGVKLTAPEWAC